MKSILKIISAFFISIVIIFLMIDISIVVQAKMEPSKTPNILGFKAFVVLSNSMHPTFDEGDLVIVKSTDTNTLEKDDIISYRNDEGSIVTHRIVDIDIENGKIGFITKGDNNNVKDDGIVYSEDIEGKYICTIRNVGKMVSIIKEPTFFPILVSVIFVIGVTVYLLSSDGSKDMQSNKKGKRFK